MKPIKIVTKVELEPLELPDNPDQIQNEKVLQNQQYSGAEANKDSYKVVFPLDTNNPEVFDLIVKKFMNLKSDPRFQGKLEVELLTFSDGTEIVVKDSKHEHSLLALVHMGVRVVQCLNSLKSRGYTKENLVYFIGFTPSGIGEQVLLASEGWVIIKF